MVAGNACADDQIIARTESWIRGFVVELGLCPFAAEPLAAGRVRILTSDAESEAELTADLDAALQRLAATPASELETLLLVHPHCLGDFEAYNQYLDVVDARLEAAGLVGAIQIASFHPAYRFADAPPDDPANFTNRSPFPMLHLLREASVERAVASCVDPEAIPRRNVECLREIGTAAIARRLAEIEGAERD